MLLGLLLAVVVRGRTDAPPAALAPRVVGRSVAPPPRLPAWIDTLLSGPRGSLRIQVVDLDEIPIAGVPLTVDGREVSSDDRGWARWDGLSAADYDVAVGGGWLATRMELSTPVYRETTLQLDVFRACPGEVRVRHADGRPVAGRRFRVAPLGAWRNYGGESDADGRATLAERPCGPVRVGVEADDGDPRWPSLTGVVDGAAPLELVLLPEATARLLVVDPDGEPLDAEVIPDAAAPIGPGLYEVRGLDRTWAGLVEAEGFAFRSVTIPLDGATHLVALEPERVVTVHMLCPTEGCDDEWTCGWDGACTGVPPTLRCVCPTTRATLYERVDEDTRLGVAAIADGAEEVTVDVRPGEAVVTATWTGPQPCKATLFGRGGHHRYSDCGEDGAARWAGVETGTWEVRFEAGVGYRGTRTLTVAEGARQVDVGAVGPDTGSLDGIVIADFPLDDARLYVEPEGLVELRGGSFVVTALPKGAEVVLTLISPTWGTFERHATEGGSVDWTIAWRSDQRRGDDGWWLDDELPGDTGVPAGETGQAGGAADSEPLELFGLR